MHGDPGSGANAIPVGGFGASRRQGASGGRGPTASAFASVSSPQHGSHSARRSPERTVYVGRLDPRVTPALLTELASHVGRVMRAHVQLPGGGGPREGPSLGASPPTLGFGFVEFASVDDAEYACRVLNLVPVFGTRVKVRMSERAEDGGTAGHLGAHLYVAGLAGDVDEGALGDVFQAYGHVVECTVVRRGQQHQGVPQGLRQGHHQQGDLSYGRVVYDMFEASDAAVAGLHGVYVPGVCGSGPLHVAYANRRDTAGGKHGGAGERRAAAEAQERRAARGRRRWVPHTLFAYGLPGEQPLPAVHPAAAAPTAVQGTLGTHVGQPLPPPHYPLGPHHGIHGAPPPRSWH